MLLLVLHGFLLWVCHLAIQFQRRVFGSYFTNLPSVLSSPQPKPHKTVACFPFSHRMGYGFGIARHAKMIETCRKLRRAAKSGESINRKQSFSCALLSTDAFRLSQSLPAFVVTDPTGGRNDGHIKWSPSHLAHTMRLLSASRHHY